MGYYIDLRTISIENYKKQLETRDMIPSRKILKENTVERFCYFKSIGIKNVYELLQTLKKKDVFLKLSKVKCFTEEYLTILLRELNSIQPKPNKIKEFAGISPDVISGLEKIGIKDTVRLFDKVKNADDRKELAKTANISDEDLLELTKLTDLSRIKWAGATFARMLYDAGIDTVEKVAKTKPEELYQKIHQLNKEKKYYKGQIGLHDMKIFVEAAKEVTLEIEY